MFPSSPAETDLQVFCAVWPDPLSRFPLGHSFTLFVASRTGALVLRGSVRLRLGPGTGGIQAPTPHLFFPAALWFFGKESSNLFAPAQVRPGPGHRKLETANSGPSYFPDSAAGGLGRMILGELVCKHSSLPIRLCSRATHSPNTSLEAH